MYGNDEVTAGGHALKYYSSVRCEVRRQMPKGALTLGHTGAGGEAPTANAVTVKVVKNKCAPPFRQAQFAIRFGIGICKLSEVLELAIEAGFIKQGGSWFTLQLPPQSSPPTRADADAQVDVHDPQQEAEVEEADLKFQGMERLRSAVESDPVLYERLTGLVAAYINGGLAPDPLADDDGSEPLLQSS
jgi:hypothetical protein|eukprot:COSAG02_NODE_434_length_22429_cov_15.013704_7_plen_188_part_00